MGVSSPTVNNANEISRERIKSHDDFLAYKSDTCSDFMAPSREENSNLYPKSHLVSSFEIGN